MSEYLGILQHSGIFQETSFTGTKAVTRKNMSTSSVPGAKTTMTTITVNRAHSESASASAVSGNDLSPWHVNQAPSDKKVERKITLMTEL